MKPTRFAIVAVIGVLGLSLASVNVLADTDQEKDGDKVLRAAVLLFPDYLDPQLSYTQEGWMAMYDAYIPLLTYSHAQGQAGSRIVPGLAQRLPRVTNGGRTYTLFLRKGLEYSNSKPVKASDFKFAIERMFRVNSPGAYLYTDIVGASKFWRKKRGGISGIQANNQSGRIRIRLARPQGTFSSRLTLLFAATLAPNTPIRNQTGSPPPATGPYVITNSQRGRRWEYARNPAWAHSNQQLMPHLPSGQISRISIAVIPNWSSLTRKITQGKLDLSLAPPAPSRYRALKRKYGRARLREEPYLATYYFWMNTKRPPFNDLRVRRAVNYAIDPSAIQRIYGNGLSASQQILPPGIPGYRKFTLYHHNMARARRLMAAANPADRTITVWTISEAPHARVTAYYRDVLRRLGFDARLKVVNGINYFTAISRSMRQDLDTGWSNWFDDYLHPINFFEPLLSGSSISRTYNLNLAQIDVPRLNRKIARLDCTDSKMCRHSRRLI